MAEINLGRVRGSDANVTKTNITEALGYTPADTELIGLLASLTTEQKTNLVAAINEVNDGLSEHKADYASLLVGGEVYQATLLNGWSNITTVGVRYRKNGLGLVIVEISVKPNALVNSNNQTFANLPMGYRPSTNLGENYFDSARGISYTGIKIGTDGGISIVNPAMGEIKADGGVQTVAVYKAVD